MRKGQGSVLYTGMPVEWYNSAIMPTNNSNNKGIARPDTGIRLIIVRILNFICFALGAISLEDPGQT